MVSVAELAIKFSDSREFALIDPRETGAYSRGHILGSTNIPLSRLELDVPGLVPCRQCEIILATDDASLVDRTRTRLQQLDYGNIHELDGGIDAWALAGYVLFSGINVVSKAFGEFIEESLETPHIDAKELHSWMRDKRQYFLLDGRTPQEHRNFCIPGALHCANGDLPAIAAELASQPELAVVVHCAGRTRSIIGAQSLIDSEIPNPVYALKNGTLDWLYEGFDLELGANRPFPESASSDPGDTRKHASDRAKEYGIKAVSENQLTEWKNQEGTTYVFDIRSQLEYESGSLEYAVNVAGGQLTQSTDNYIGVRNSRIVLCDDDGVRAASTAIWLKRMGWRNLYTHTMVSPSYIRAASEVPEIVARTISVVQLKEMVDSHSVTVLDIRRGVKYQRGHIPGAHYVSRHLAEYPNKIPGSAPVVLVADDPEYCSLVAAECADFGRDVSVLQGGMREWRKNRFEIESTEHNFLCQPLDAYLDPGDFANPAIDAREGRRYLKWEIELADLLEGEPAAMFST